MKKVRFGRVILWTVIIVIVLMVACVACNLFAIRYLPVPGLGM